MLSNSRDSRLRADKLAEFLCPSSPQMPVYCALKDDLHDVRTQSPYRTSASHSQPVRRDTECTNGRRARNGHLDASETQLERTETTETHLLDSDTLTTLGARRFPTVPGHEASRTQNLKTAGVQRAAREGSRALWPRLEAKPRAAARWYGARRRHHVEASSPCVVPTVSLEYGSLGGTNECTPRELDDSKIWGPDVRAHTFAAGVDTAAPAFSEPRMYVCIRKPLRPTPGAAVRTPDPRQTVKYMGAGAVRWSVRWRTQDASLSQLRQLAQAA